MALSKYDSLCLTCRREPCVEEEPPGRPRQSAATPCARREAMAADGLNPATTTDSDLNRHRAAAANDATYYPRYALNLATG